MSIDPLLIERIAMTLLHSLWQGLLVWFATSMLLRMMRNASPATRYRVAVLGMAICVALPIGTFFVLDNTPAPVASQASISTAAVVSPPVSIAAVDWSSWQAWLAVTWICGAVLFGLRILLGSLGTLRLGRSREDLPADLQAIAKQLAKAMRFRKTPRVGISRRLRMACAFGIFRPVVLLPMCWVTNMPIAALEAVLAHELAHLKRLDLWVIALQRSFEAVLFFHPAIWRLSSRVRWERELCCDARAIAAGADRIELARVLLSLAEERAAARHGRETTSPFDTLSRAPVLAAGLGGNEMNLTNRVRHVLGQDEPKRPRRRGGTTAAIVIALGLFAVPAAYMVAPGFADDDDDKPEKERKEAKKEREGERERAERDRGERDRERGERDRPRREREREGDRPRRDREREGDRPRRDGERPRGERDRDGDRPRREGERDRDRERGERDKPRPPFREGDRPRPPREREPDGFRPPRGNQGELIRAIAELRRQVEQLRREVRELRGQRGERRDLDRPPRPPARREVDPRRPDARDPRRDRPRPDAREPRPDRPSRGEPDRPRRERDRPDRPARDPEPDRPKVRDR